MRAGGKQRHSLGHCATPDVKHGVVVLPDLVVSVADLDRVRGRQRRSKPARTTRQVRPEDRGPARPDVRIVEQLATDTLVGCRVRGAKREVRGDLARGGVEVGPRRRHHGPAQKRGRGSRGSQVPENAAFIDLESRRNVLRFLEYERRPGRSFRQLRSTDAQRLRRRRQRQQQDSPARQNLPQHPPLLHLGCPEVYGHSGDHAYPREIVVLRPIRSP